MNRQDDLVLNPRPWFTWIFGSLVLCGLLALAFGRPLAETGRRLLAEHFAAEAERRLADADYEACARAVRSARRWSPQHPPVLRAALAFLDQAGGEDQARLHFLRELVATGEARIAERARIGLLLLSRGEVQSARIELERFSEAERGDRHVQELVAGLERADGFPERADRTLRAALAAEPEDPECRLRLAELDARDPYAETRRRARAVFFELASGGDVLAVRALDRLVRDSELTGDEAQRLLELTEAHPQAGQARRLDALATLLRARPQDRADRLEAAVAEARGFDAEQLGVFTGWLIGQGEAARALDLLPVEQARKSSQLFNLYIAALARLGRWTELEAELKRPGVMPMSRHGIHLWLAQAANQRRDGLGEVRQALRAALMAAGEGAELTATQRTAEIAEQTSQWDLAAAACEGIARHHPRTRAAMLEKLFEFAVRDKDTAAAARAAARLAELQPQNDQALFRARWFSLVAGGAIEADAERLLGESPRFRRDGPRHLLLALAAFRMGDLERTRAHLGELGEPSALNAGQRAVHAGLLSVCGDAGPAFRLAEHVPAALLLPEELRFLQRAL
jgi:hypothetical protein